MKITMQRYELLLWRLICNLTAAPCTRRKPNQNKKANKERAEQVYTCVCPPVSLELVTSGKPLATEDPVADEGPLAGVPAQVGPQVGRLAINLAASFHVTDVLFLLRRVPTVSGTHTVITSVSSKTWKNI